ncbi:MAG: acetyltransferase [Sulfuriferula sp.]|nr:acetyltransferase [Sulfuriferula sp.]
MSFIDVFNGDADGLCALQQLRLSQPVDSRLITGVKRDIDLLKQVDAEPDDIVTVLDVSLDKNREPLLNLLDRGLQVNYFDHHFAGEIPSYPNLHSHIDLSADTCTSALVNNFLNGQFSIWAVVGAYGDNLAAVAERIAMPLALADDKLALLRELGECLNYNGYGETLDDLYFHPDNLSIRMRAYADPFEFMQNDPAFATLRAGYADDMAKAELLQPTRQTAGGAVFFLPDAVWSRRVSGVYSNALASNHPNRAHAILSHNSTGGYTVSVRAPMVNKTGADTLCRQFPSGGGRKGAAGINNLQEDMLPLFFEQFDLAYPGV